MEDRIRDDYNLPEEKETDCIEPDHTDAGDGQESRQGIEREQERRQETAGTDKRPPVYADIPVSEQNTVIYSARGRRPLVIVTTDRITMQKLDRLCEKSSKYLVSEVEEKDGENGPEIVSKTYICKDKGLISLRR